MTALHSRWTPFEDRLWGRIDASGDCWEWTGCIKDDGYAQIRVADRQKMVHRVVWEALVGPIPSGMQLDHLCRVRHCVNPDHLEVVSARVNTLRSYNTAGLHARRSHCRWGHPLSGANLRVEIRATRQYRTCRACRAGRDAVRYAKRRGVA